MVRPPRSGPVHPLARKIQSCCRVQKNPLRVTGSIQAPLEARERQEDRLTVLPPTVKNEQLPARSSDGAGFRIGRTGRTGRLKMPCPETPVRHVSRTGARIDDEHRISAPGPQIPGIPGRSRSSPAQYPARSSRESPWPPSRSPKSWATRRSRAHRSSPASTRF